jgi:hypothetical protein
MAVDERTYFVTLAITLDANRVRSGDIDPPHKWDWHDLIEEVVQVVAHSES